MLMQLQNVGKSFGEDVIFQDVTVTIEDRRRIGLIGPNGAGKTTLFNIIAGALTPDSGTVDRQGGLTVGYLRQHAEEEMGAGRTIIEELRGAFASVFAKEEEMLSLSHQMANADPQALPTLTQAYAQVQAEFEAAGGHDVEIKINTVLTGMGFADVSLHGRDKEVGKLSGGERIRLAMAKLLLLQPGLLLLDEPTNHLDFKTLAWLEGFLQGYKGTVIAVSHDRYFLDRVCGEIWEMDGESLYSYTGNYSHYRTQKEERMERQMKLYLRQQEEIAKLKDYVARNMARASTTAMAQSRQNQLDKMELIKKPRDTVRPIHITFAPRRRPGKEVLAIENLSLAVGQGEKRRLLAEGLSLLVERGEKIALIGQNGTGKTTFINTITGKHPADAGDITWGVNVDYALFEQLGGELDPALTVLDQMRDKFPKATDQELRTALGCIGLSGDDVFRRVGALSGGEKARLRFAIIAKEQPNFLLLDEPTNHLDLAAREALEEALAAYEGTILVISHDRYLLDKLPSRIVELSGGRLTSYAGRYEDYMEKSSPRDSGKTPKAEGEKSGQAQYQNAKVRRSEEAKRRRDLAAVQEELARLEGEIIVLEQAIGDPQNAADFAKLGELCRQMDEVREAHGRKLEQWVLLED